MYVVHNNDVLVLVFLINVTNEYTMNGYSHNVHIPNDDGTSLLVTVLIIITLTIYTLTI